LIDEVLFFGINNLNFVREEPFLNATSAEMGTWLVLLCITILILIGVALLTSVARCLTDTALAWTWVASDDLLVVTSSASDVAFLFLGYQELEDLTASNTPLLVASFSVVSDLACLWVRFGLSLASAAEHLTLDTPVIPSDLIVGVFHIAVRCVAILAT
jgi:hypothetical protein